ncbi:MAG: Fic family protein [Bacteroidota bacterium]
MAFNSRLAFNLPMLSDKADWMQNELYTDLLIKARAELGELKGYLSALPNPQLLLSPAVIRESLASSEIENIHTTLESVLKNQLFNESERTGADKEVLRYREALLWGTENLQKIALSSRLINGINLQLRPTEYAGYRNTQNHIQNSATGEVIYTPPSPADLQALMGNWENFTNRPDSPIDPLIRAAVSHYQFEAIHPFADGNGRTGRILMVLQLIDAGIIDQPVLYISGYINKNKAEYYRHLLSVSTGGEWDAFIRFMLKGFCLQAIETKGTLFSIMSLMHEFKQTLKDNFKSIYSSDLAESFFFSPIQTPSRLARSLNIHRNTATHYLKTLAEGGVLKTFATGRHQLYIYSPLPDLLNSKRK